VGYVVAGIVMLALSAVIWVGMIRPQGFIFAAVPWTVLPGFGLFFVAVGLEQTGVLPHNSPAATIGFLALAAGVVLLIWQPPWWGPRWYRERQARRT